MSLPGLSLLALPFLVQVTACGGEVERSAAAARADAGDSGCSAYAPLVLIATDAVTGAPVCDAQPTTDTAVATYLAPYKCGPYADCLDASCPYFVFGYEPVAGFPVTVSAPGYASVTLKDVTSPTCACVPDASACAVPKVLRVALHPLDGGT